METDLDLGHYERFLDVELPGVSNITTGKIYKSVITKERNGEYLGACVQIIPHITDEIKYMIRRVAGYDDFDVVLVELGGTVGDIESQPFLEALRQLRNEEGSENVMFVHVTFVPYIETAGEFKTKPTQHSTKELRSTGIVPDIIVCRSKYPIDDALREKVALFCDVSENAVINTPDADSIYEIPLTMEEYNVGEIISNRINLDIDFENDVDEEHSLEKWAEIVEKLSIKSPQLTVGVIGKYVDLEDSYISIREALNHAAAHVGVKLNIDWINSDNSLDEKTLKDLDGILIPGGFGERGAEGKLMAIDYAIENDVPIFGICLGMQTMVIQFARRNGMDDANSIEFDENTPYPVIDMMEEQKNIKELGGTMRLGSYDCELVKGTKAYESYGCDLIRERHRHRYEFNNEYRDELVNKGLTISGTSLDNFLVEIIELADHPWFVGCQFHPEFKSRPEKPHPLFKSFVASTYENAKKNGKIDK